MWGAEEVSSCLDSQLANMPSIRGRHSDEGFRERAIMIVDI